jgi:hypothetical protein
MSEIDNWFANQQVQTTLDSAPDLHRYAAKDYV